MMLGTERSLAADVRRRAEGRHLVLLLDFDGTLTEFAPDPQAVFLPASRRDEIRRIQQHATVGIVSGRRLQDVRARVGIDVAVVAGLHGLEIDGLGERFVHPDMEKAHAAVSDVSEGLRAIASALPGAFVEEKGASVALHYRETDLAGQRVALDSFGTLAAPLIERGLLRLMRGSYVLELLPNIDWNKGHAVQWMVERIRREREPLVVYIGDDVTDQYALDVVAELGGVAIAASGRARAPERLDGPQSVERFLAAL